MYLANLHTFGNLTKFSHIRQNRQVRQHGGLPMCLVNVHNFSNLTKFRQKFQIRQYGWFLCVELIQISLVITWASQRETKFKNAPRYFCCCFLPSVTNRRLGPNTHAHD